MLTGLLTSIKDQLSKSYLVAALFPVVLALLANGIMAYRHSPAFRAWIRAAEALQDSALLYAAVLAAVIALAYVFSTLNSVLLEALEGRRAPVRWLAGPFHHAQWKRLRTLEARYHQTVIDLAEVTSLKARWEQRRQPAVQAGAATGVCGSFPTGIVGAVAGPHAGAYRRLRRLQLTRQMNRLVAPRDLDAADTALIGILQTNSATLPDASSRALAAAAETFGEILRYARDRLQLERLVLYKTRQFTYPGRIDPPDERSTDSLLAATTLGNIGRTMRSYAQTRYQMDLDLFWTRLHSSLQRNAADYLATLQDAKIQVDFLVGLTWLTAIFTVVWSALLVFAYPSIREFLIVSIVGPLAARGCYLVACQSYSVFADLMRSSVDLFRFQLLADLHLPLPYGTDDERRLWVALGNTVGYGAEAHFRYAHSGNGR